MHFHTGNFFIRWTTQLLLITSGTLLCLLYRGAYRKNHWHQSHPLSHLPFAVLIALLWAYAHTVLEYHWLSDVPFRDLTAGIVTQYNQFPWFPFFFSQFIGTSHILLIWLMLYIFIQGERHSSQAPKNPAWKYYLASVAALLAFFEACRILIALAYYNPPGYLFSRFYFADSAYTLLPALMFAGCTILLKPRERLFGSALLPMIPGLAFIIFFGGVVALIIYKLLPFMDRMRQTPLQELPQSVFRTITTLGPVWQNPSELVGTLRSRLDTQAVIVLLLMYWRFSTAFAPLHSQPANSFNIHRWLKFWIYNLTGWWLVGTYVYFAEWPQLEPLVPELKYRLPLAGVALGACSSVLLRALMRSHHLTASSIPIFTLKIALISCVLGLILTVSLWLLGYLYIFAVLDAEVIQSYETAIATGTYFVPCFSLSSLCYFLWAMIYEKSVSQRAKNSAQLHQLKLEKNLKELQLNALAGQIDPHFVFNALNNIRALVREDSEKARDAILALSDMLRTPLIRNTQDKVCLRDELALIKNYIALSKIQLEHRLDYQETRDSGLDNALIPPMVLQILIENALKHGICQLPDGGTLSLDISAQNNRLHCRIRNSGQLRPQPGQQGLGVGLNNVRERLALLYGSRASLNLTELQQVVQADLIIPLEHAA